MELLRHLFKPSTTLKQMDKHHVQAMFGQEHGAV
jgi:hypothetical protein